MPQLPSPPAAVDVDGEWVELDAVPQGPWVNELLHDTKVYLPKEQRFATVICPIFVLENQPTMFRLMLWFDEGTTWDGFHIPARVEGWHTDLLGRGYDGSQILQPCLSWVGGGVNEIDGVEITESVAYLHDLVAYLYEALTDKVFPGFTHGQLPEVHQAMLTRKLRLSEQRAARTLPTRKPEQRQPGSAPPVHTPAANMQEHPDLPVPYEKAVTQVLDNGTPDIINGGGAMWESEETVAPNKAR